MVVRDQERQAVQDAADEGASSGDRAAHDRAAAAGELARVREPLRERHADAGAECGGEARDERVPRVVRGERDREDRCEGRQRAVDEPDHGGLHLLEEEDVVVGHPTRVYPSSCNQIEHQAVLTKSVRGA